MARTPYTDRAVRIFCLSVQRTGTTSVAKFLVDFGYQFAGWPTSLRLGWTDAWYEGAYEAIFSSDEFRLANAYSDAPWFMPDFYRVLFHRFPNARFVLFERDPDAWFRSMQAFFHGEIIGPARIHCRMYRRELEYLELLRSGAIDERIENQVESRKTMKLEGHAAHYKDVYRLHNLEVRDFFRRHAPSSLFYAKLEDPTKWQGLGKFLGLDVPGGYEVHMHDSAQA